MKRSFLFAIMIITITLNASNETKRNHKINKNNHDISKIFNHLNIQYTKQNIYDPQVRSARAIIITKNSYTSSRDNRMFYLSDMISKKYIAPLAIRFPFPRTILPGDALEDLIIYTYEDLFEGDFIGEFTGKVSLAAEPSKYAHTSIMLVHPNNHLVVDASKHGNELRFIRKSKSNHNCKRLDILSENGLAHIIYVVSRYIDEKEELILEDDSEEEACKINESFNKK